MFKISPVIWCKINCKLNKTFCKILVQNFTFLDVQNFSCDLMQNKSKNENKTFCKTSVQTFTFLDVQSFTCGLMQVFWFGFSRIFEDWKDEKLKSVFTYNFANHFAYINIVLHIILQIVWQCIGFSFWVGFWGIWQGINDKTLPSAQQTKKD